MSEDFMSTKEVARYLGIHEKQVYALIRAGRIPATRATGKWLFPRQVIDEWLEADAKAGLEEARRKGVRAGGALLAAGSNDPVLDILEGCLHQAKAGLYLFSASTGSMEGLKALDRGYTDIAWSHLFHPESGEYNTPYLEELLPSIKAVVVCLFFRELGFVTAPGNPRGIGQFSDLARSGVRFVNRQAGSGTRLFIDQALLGAGIQAEAIQGYDRQVYTHLEVGMEIWAGRADAGIATRAAARLLGLDFLPVTTERFDMICSQATFFQKGVQVLLEVLAGEEFRRRVGALGSYDFSSAGKVIHVKG